VGMLILTAQRAQSVDQDLQFVELWATYDRLSVLEQLGAASME
jgi:hypothetical protein